MPPIEPSPLPPVRVWGLAAGRASTKEAARGAFTHRVYRDGVIPSADWIQVIDIITLTVRDLEACEP